MEEKLRSLTIGKSLVIGLILAAGYYFWLYDDGHILNDQIKASKIEIEKSKAEVEKIRKAIEDAERYQQTMQNLGAEMERVLKAIPAKINSLDLMKIISTEAKTVGIDINSLTAPQIQKNSSAAKDGKSFFEAVPVDISVTGTYNQVMLFLSNLTKLDKIITAKSLTLITKTQGSGANSTPSIELKASFTAYRFVSEEPSAPVPVPAPAAKGAGK